MWKNLLSGLEHRPRLRNDCLVELVVFRISVLGKCFPFLRLCRLTGDRYDFLILFEVLLDSGAIAYADPYAGPHSTLVFDLCARIAPELDMGPTRCPNLRLGLWCHRFPISLLR